MNKEKIKMECKCWKNISDDNRFFIVRSEPDWTPLDPDFNSDTVDLIYECNNCHTLYRLYLKPVKFVELKEGNTKRNITDKEKWLGEE